MMSCQVIGALISIVGHIREVTISIIGNVLCALIHILVADKPGVTWSYIGFTINWAWDKGL